jgi:two-component system, NarL family, nitrate/nitrite sensor histidine kinase NarX
VSSLPAARAADPAILAEITAGLAAGDEVREVLDRFLDPLMRLAHARGGAVRMLSADGMRFELVASIGLSPHVRQLEHSVHSQCGFCGAAASGAQIVWSTDLAVCARRSDAEYFGRECRGALAVPLQHKGRTLGVYNLFFGSDEQPPQEVAALLRSVGDLLGLALDHLRLEAEHMRASVMQERQRMAGEVHDALAQSLGFVKMRLPLLRDAIEGGEKQQALRYVQEVRETLTDAHSSLREIITHFRTRSGDGGIAQGLESLAARFGMRTGIPLTLDNRMPRLQLGEPEEAEVYHIIQEALANIERHAQARHGWVTVEPTPDGAEVRIEDDGVGGAGSDSRTPGHHGLEIMRERARRLGAGLTLAARPGGGSVVRLVLPAAKGQGEAA